IGMTANNALNPDVPEDVRWEARTDAATSLLPYLGGVGKNALRPGALRRRDKNIGYLQETAKPQLEKLGLKLKHNDEIEKTDLDKLLMGLR
ncbi:hypothetical protein, partial [Salmonella sp. SAL4357]|uniref:hypothetical protein n=1 Tax=Salmonella sp. SAL4357 TaxID=3159878 RepID=UPI003979C8C2